VFFKENIRKELMPSVENSDFYNNCYVSRHMSYVGILCEVRSQKIFGNFAPCIRISCSVLIIQTPGEAPAVGRVPQLRITILWNMCALNVFHFSAELLSRIFFSSLNIQRVALETRARTDVKCQSILPDFNQKLECVDKW
jgi:hypothetical protein